ncbi:MAG: PadR family transcriptional regulator, partial [Planctomycetota bacterium]
MAGLKRQQAEFLNGVPELVVLRLLASREMYGYEIVNEIRKTSDQVLTFGEGVIYPMLHSLEKKKYLG